MSLNKLGICYLDLPSPTAETVKTFDELPTDPYCKNRFRRFSQYRMVFDKGWQLYLLPPRPHIQAANHNSYVGGVLRNYQQLIANPFAYVEMVATSIPLNEEDEWQVDVHQWRMLCSEGGKTVSVPEGPHRDGHEFVSILVVRRTGVDGGETQLFHDSSRTPFYSRILDTSQGIVLDDRRMLHFTTDICCACRNGGYRDVFIITFNRWTERHYGPEFEARALGGRIGGTKVESE